ncbi:hypothetical protein BHY_1007 (plasmid) [Borrelia nietonii YOR]|uniref:Uncharacterized protein n=2 Tax=Borrelia TaxID=138 RepID=W5SB84_9SPIR|nr:hypothetical protein BHY_1007 [Borrelia nietonii YOR]AHH14528.1 hypothetical protein BHW_0900021 [Borrelia hermsii MTW]
MRKEYGIFHNSVINEANGHLGRDNLTKLKEVQDVEGLIA